MTVGLPRGLWLRRALALLFLAVVAVLLVVFARKVDWDEVGDALRGLPLAALLGAAAFAATSHLLYSTFDLLGRRYTGHKLATRTVMKVTFISYAFNLCVGSLVGGVGLRYRLYSRLGLAPGVITRVVTMSMLTNWLGYMLLAGGLFLLHPLALPPSWHMGNHGLQWLGAALMAVPLAYMLACGRAGNQVWWVRGHELYLPRSRMALLQMAISCLNWSLMAGVIYTLLRAQVAYVDVLTVLLVGAVAGVMLHVPAGIGVMEGVFVALLGHSLPPSQLLAALLAYRAIYYLAPLAAATLMVVVMEMGARMYTKLRTS